MTTNTQHSELHPTRWRDRIEYDRILLHVFLMTTALLLIVPLILACTDRLLDFPSPDHRGNCHNRHEILGGVENIRAWFPRKVRKLGTANRSVLR